MKRVLALSLILILIIGAMSYAATDDQWRTYLESYDVTYVSITEEEAPLGSVTYATDSQWRSYLEGLGSKTVFVYMEDEEVALGTVKDTYADRLENKICGVETGDTMMASGLR